MDRLRNVSRINQIINENIEPFIDVMLKGVKYKEKYIAYLKVPCKNNKPYILKKDSPSIKIYTGDIYIRKGATTFKANRTDLDKMYNEQHIRKIKLYDNYLSIAPVDIGEIKKDKPTFGTVKI